MVIIHGQGWEKVALADHLLTISAEKAAGFKGCHGRLWSLLSDAYPFNLMFQTSIGHLVWFLGEYCTWTSLSFLRVVLCLITSVFSFCFLYDVLVSAISVVFSRGLFLTLSSNYILVLFYQTKTKCFLTKIFN